MIKTTSYLYGILISLMAFISCNYQNSNLEDVTNEKFDFENLKKEFQIKYKITNEFSFEVEGRNILLTMAVKENSFVDVITNDIIVHAFLLDNFEQFKNFDTVKIEYFYEWEKENIRDLVITNEELNAKNYITNHTDEGKRLSCVTRDVISNLNYKTLYSYNQIIELVKQYNDEGLFNNYRAFWDLIVAYCEDEENIRSDLEYFDYVLKYDNLNIDRRFLLKLIENGCKCDEKSKERI